ncbi:ankyrin repeat and SOCS box protein 5-like isoform X1 [Paramormyrops kingsleyae]|nr:ankyrin repeat and SOCS box protein 2-like isoform X1 [Paramormyrops kingsleyae]XP_023660752.1 ankyrin repeat and SOCS box protein 2-like isoform X1 [Paramormyrops kingsleyae]XP_023660753.1 ankyrin repeat and SOCS box protein 2-like isoform X1 [Paramormyrops kingsleyae]XP_023660755.1 ankyrin repeat and SOCS box protein 2-like isoform X1 [Paramormyrops kingsleyae]XP_023660756.1 ankyrin repeat and SOCS box protein 2-like isoform X1 [Paramormyrops kingsleyae]
MGNPLCYSLTLNELFCSLYLCWLSSRAMGFSISSLSRAEVRCAKPLGPALPRRTYQYAPKYNYKWTEVHYEASRGNLDKLRMLLFTLDREQIDRRDYYGKTPLYWAAYKGQRASLELLLRHGADVNAQCKHGSTPLHATVGLFPECALILIRHGADVDLPDVWGVTPMYQAACSGQVQCIHLLVRAGARINYKNKKTGEAPKQLSVRPALLNWLESLLREPHSLKHQCRQVVHRALGPARIWALGSLPLPPAIRDYLMFQDLQIPDSTGLGPSEDQAFG